MKVPTVVRAEFKLASTVLARALLAHLLARLIDAESKPASIEAPPKH